MQFYGEHDVVVVGGGTAGVVAAIAAARNGAQVLLVEQGGFLGGVSTGAMVTSFLSFHNMRGEQIAGGIAQEIVDRLLERGGAVAPGHLFNPYGNAYSVTPFDAEVLKVVLFELVRGAGVKLLLHTTVTDTVMTGNTICGVAVHNKAGFGLALGRVVIDASGDGDVAARAGAPWEMGGPEGETMAMSLMFRLADVDPMPTIHYLKEHPDQFIIAEDPYLRQQWSIPELLDRVQSFHDIPMITGFFDLIKESQARGQFPRSRNRLIFVITPKPGVVFVNTSAVVSRNTLSPADLTAAAVELREQVAQLTTFFRTYIPGFAQCWLLDAAPQIGVRDSRRILGGYVLTKDDVLTAREFDDTIGKGAYCIDIHRPNGVIVHYHIQDGKAFNVPYRCLVPRGVENLLVAGRCISVDHEALGATREQVCCMVQGQAAGTAAAMALAGGTTPRELNVAALQQRLGAQGQIL